MRRAMVLWGGGGVVVWKVEGFARVVTSRVGAN